MSDLSPAAQQEAARAQLRQDCERTIALAGDAFPPVLAKLIAGEIAFMAHKTWLGEERRLRELLAEVRAVASRMQRGAA